MRTVCIISCHSDGLCNVPGFVQQYKYEVRQFNSWNGPV